MATYVDTPTSIWEGLGSDDHQSYVNDMIDESYFMDAREDVIYRFYEGRLSYKAAEAMAIIWANAFQYHEWSDPHVTEVATKLELDWKESYLILGQRDKYFKEMENKDFWRYPESEYVDTRDDVRGWDL